MLIRGRSGFKGLGSGIAEDYALPKAKLNENPRGKTYVFQLTATRLIDDASIYSAKEKARRKATVVIPLPRRAAMVVEIETPSRDFLFFGIFLASLQIFDGVLTSMGLDRFGMHAEGNPMMRHLMEYVGPHQALLTVKILAIIFVAVLTVLAKRLSWIKDLIGVLSCIYLFAAVIPWVYLLFVKYHGTAF